jgi:integrase
VYSVAIANEKLIFNPASLIKRKPENNLIVRYLKEEPDNNEEKRLVAVIAKRSPFYLPTFMVSVYTGIRRSEQIALKWPDIDIRKNDHGQNILTLWKTKPGKTRRIPVNKVVIDCLKVLQERDRSKGRGHIFLNVDGNPVKTPRDWFDDCVKLAGIEDYTWHCNRHTFASRMVMKGADLVTVSQMLGHATIQMTMRYAHLAPDHKMAAVEKIVPDNWTGLSAYIEDAKSSVSENEVSTKSATREKSRKAESSMNVS